MKNLKRMVALSFLLVTGLAQGAVTGFNFTTLASFNDTNNGAYPYAPPAFGADGRLYCMLYEGGTNGYGVIAAVTTNGVQTNLHVFAHTDGAYPVGQLFSAADGALYGAASSGGAYSNGVMFKITTNGQYTLLHTLGAATNEAGYSADGSSPFCGLTQGRDGNFYGMTYSGGTSNLGTVFQMSASGTLTTLHSFTGTGSDGTYPYTAPLVEGSDGIFYGTTSAGGVSNNGTIFQITADGTLTTLFEFTTNGANPYAGLAFGDDGCLYGSTVYGGTNNYGTAFRVSTNGTFTVLHQFGGTDGLYYPEGGLLPGGHGVFYGTCYYGGSADYGALFQLTSDGLISTIYSFTDSADGAHPYAGLIRDSNNKLYGAALYGGKTGGYGTVFRWSDPTRPTNTLTAPTAGERWSNFVFTAAGKAKDNVGTAQVLVSVNQSAWTSAVSANHWSNWTAQIQLVPGTNLFQAYCVDYSGNCSATNSVNFDFVVTNQLSLRTWGLGAIKPNYSNAWLEIGRNYSIAAAPATGFVFTNWTVSTNWVGGLTVSGTNLQFMMGSNLTVQANFVDVSKPTLTFTAPTAGQKMTNALATVTGKASDNWRVTNVWYQLNQGDWNLAATTNRFTNWNSPLLTLVAGTNTVRAYALDWGGNASTTNSVSFVSSNTFKLQMAFALWPPLTSTGLNLTLQMSPNLSGRIEVSTNLFNWQVLTNFRGTNTDWKLWDPAATYSAQRFYRAVIP